MDLSDLLAWFTVMVSIGPVVRAWRLGAPRIAWPTLVIWAALALGLLAWPAGAGFIAAGTALIVLGLPSLPARLVVGLVRSGRFEEAGRLLHLWSRWTRSAEGRLQAERLTAYGEAEDGRVSDALGRLRKLRHPVAELDCLRIQGRWEALLEAARHAPPSGEAAVWAFRASGELGRLDEDGVDAFVSAQRLSGNDPMPLLALAGFCGDPGGVRLIGRIHRGTIRVPVRRFWEATALQVAGRPEAVVHFRALLDEGGLVGEGARERLAHPLGPPPADVMDLWATLRARLEDLDRYGLIFRPGRRPAPVTGAFVLVLLSAHVAALGIPELDKFGLFGLLTPYTGQPWRIVTASLVHAGWLHVGFNTLALWLFGRPLENLIGGKALAAVLVSSMVAAKGSILVLDTVLGLPPAGYVGASDGVMALVGVLAVVLFRAGRRGSPIAQRQLWVVALVIGVQVLFDLLHPQVSLKAHLFGLVFGVLMGVIARETPVSTVESGSSVRGPVP